MNKLHIEIWPTIEGKLNQAVAFKTNVLINFQLLFGYRLSARGKKLALHAPDLTIEVIETIKKCMLAKEFEVRKLIRIAVT